jgi:hypothetical protein
MEWKVIDGNWKIEGNSLIQEDTKTVPYGISIKDKFISDSYVFEGKVTLLSRADFPFTNVLTKETIKMKHGEAKIFYNKASETKNGKLTENYRIDLINQESRGTCRLAIAGIYVNEIPVNFKENVPLNFRLILKTVLLQDGKTTILTFYLNEHPIFYQIPIYEDFDGYIGVGSFNSSVKFENLVLHEFPKKNCFMIMQYDTRRKYLFEEVVKNVIKEIEKESNYKFNEVVLLSDCLESGSIYEQLTKLLNSADILIVDISTNNLNVFFELGFGAGLNKKVIMLKEKESKVEIPSDLRDRRYFEYDLPVQHDQLKKEIERLKPLLKRVILNELSPRGQ